MLAGHWKYIFNNSLNITAYYPDSPGGYQEDGEVWTVSGRRGESMRRGGQLQTYLCNLTPWYHEKPVHSNTCSLIWQPSLGITVFIIDNGIFILIFHFFCTIWHIYHQDLSILTPAYNEIGRFMDRAIIVITDFDN